jgi:hypothetical protein
VGAATVCPAAPRAGAAPKAPAAARAARARRGRVGLVAHAGTYLSNLPARGKPPAGAQVTVTAATAMLSRRLRPLRTALAPRWTRPVSTSVPVADGVPAEMLAAQVVDGQLSLGRAPVPTPGSGELLIRVSYAGARSCQVPPRCARRGNAADACTRRCQPPGCRPAQGSLPAAARGLANTGARVAANAWLLRPQLAAARQQTVRLLHVRAAVLSLCWQGLEVSGTVVQEASVGGSGARAGTSCHVGDQVCALVAGGGYAEYVTAPTATCMRVPSGFTLAEAAALPETFFTVWCARPLPAAPCSISDVCGAGGCLRRTVHAAFAAQAACHMSTPARRRTNVFQRGVGGAELQAGETLLVHGGSSGIGTTAIQVAKHRGAKVIMARWWRWQR